METRPRGRVPLFFRNGQITRTFSDLKYTSANINCILKDIVHFIFAHRGTNVYRLHEVYSTAHSWEIMDSFIMAKYCRCILNASNVSNYNLFSQAFGMGCIFNALVCWNCLVHVLASYRLLTGLNWAKMIWAASWENLYMPYANNKGADQHLCC